MLADPDGRTRVEDLLQQQKMVARGLLDANRHLVEALRDALIERHELVGREITTILEHARDGQVVDLRDHALTPR